MQVLRDNDQTKYVKEILSKAEKAKAACIIDVDDFAGLVVTASQDRLYLIDEVRTEAGRACREPLACLPYLFFFTEGINNGYTKMKRYVESDRQMDCTSILDGKPYTCGWIEELYSAAKENIGKLTSRLKEILSVAGIGEDEAVYLISGCFSWDYLIKHYCRENLSEDALLHDDRIYVWREFALEQWTSEMECDSGKEPENREAEMTIFIDSSDKGKMLIPKAESKESGHWHKVKLTKEYFDNPLKVSIYRKTYELTLPSDIKTQAFIDYVMRDEDTFTIEVKFWGKTRSENHLYLRDDSSYMGSDNKTYHYDFSHPPKKL